MYKTMNIFLVNVLYETIGSTPLTFWDWFWWVLLILVLMIPWVVIIVLWICKRYTVRFIGFHGEVIFSKSYKKNSLFEFPVDFEIPGYEFEGWYEDAELTVPLSFNYVTDRNVKIYGKWIKKNEI